MGRLAVEDRLTGSYVSKRAFLPLPTRFPVSSIIILLISLSIIITGCGSSAAANGYIEQTKDILDGISNSLAELKEYWTLPLEDQGGLKKTLDEYNEAVDKGQELLDHVDSPAPCRDLEDLLTYVMEKAKLIGTLTTQFGDYTEDMSKVATDISDLVGELEVFMTKKGLPAGARQMFEKANSINADVKSTIPPPLFQGVQVEFTDFMAGITEQFQKAAEKASGWKPEDSGSTDEEEQAEEDAEPQDNYKNKALTPMLEDVPEKWLEFNAKLAEWMEAAREVSGLNTSYAEFDQLMLQTKEEIKKIEKKYL
ncbi:MAG: hypothetical protein JW738_03330 [Actinobacteria bacterium]|nr:hypothetical protein [Actinomycetota bacterium]